MSKNQTRTNWVQIFPAWYELNGEWSLVSSFWWEQEEQIRKILSGGSKRNKSEKFWTD
jgi:hypothetical protein